MTDESQERPVQDAQRTLEGQVRELTRKNKALHKMLAEQADRVRSLEASLESERADPNDDYVMLGGKAHPIIGNFRADNTFVEVKRGHCPEGITLIAIDKVH